MTKTNIICVKNAGTKFLDFSRYLSFMNHLNSHMIIHKLSEYSNFFDIFYNFYELITKK